MALEITKTTRVIGTLKIGDEVVKTYDVNIDDNGVSTVYEAMANPELYSKNRAEMRKQEKEFREKRYEIEDAILAESEADKAKESD